MATVPDADEPRRRRWWVIGAALAVVIAGAVAAVLTVPPPSEPEQTVAPQVTGEVTRGDISERVRTTGRLGFGEAWDIGSALPGTVTSVAAFGAVVERGGELFRVDDEPVVLLIGALPAWRSFESGMQNGRDVLQLEENLRDLGYFSDEPDQRFTWATTEAIMAWQEARGLERTGRLPLGSAVFETEPVRIGAEVTPIGSPSGGTVVSVTATSKILTVDLDPSLAASVSVNAQVDVRLPNGTSTTATVASIAPPAERKTSDGTALRLPVQLTIDDPAVVGDLVDVGVTVELVNVLASDVMRVPVTALLAGPDGTTMIEIVAGQKLDVQQVKLGVQGDGLIEVISDEISVGDRVVIAG